MNGARSGAEPAWSQGENGMKNGKRVLIVDDSSFMRNSLKAILEKALLR